MSLMSSLVKYWIGPGLVVATCLFVSPVSWAEEIAESSSKDPENEDTTLVYGQVFFANHPNAVTALDIIRRIPTGRRIVASTRTDQRGFSTNEDRILVDGRRITGKRNGSLDTLGRITPDQIERIEIIRGESPDIRFSSGEAVLNVVMIQQERSNSGSWKMMAEAIEGIDVGLNGTLTYSLKKGRLATVLSADRREQVRTFKLNDRLFDASDRAIEDTHIVSRFLRYGVALKGTKKALNPI